MADQNNDKPTVETPLLPWETKGGGTSVRAAAENLSNLLTDDLVIDTGEGDESDDADVAEAAEKLEGLLDDDEDEGDDPSDADDEEDASDEDADDEDEGADDGEEEDTSDDEPRYEVEYPDGTKAQLTLDELKKEHLRQADYTRKTTEVAEARKQAEANREETRKAREEYVTRLGAVKEALESVAPKKRTAAEWDALKQRSPAEFAAEWADTQRYEQERAAVEAEEQRVRGEAQKEWEEQLRTRLAEEQQRLFEVVPEWQDDEVRSKELADLKSFAEKKYGFTEEELGQVYDHRLMLLLRDASQFNDVSTKGKPQIEKKRKAAKVLQPGGRARKSPGKNKSQAKRIRDKQRKLARTGSLDDAAALIMESLDDE